MMNRPVVFAGDPRDIPKVLAQIFGGPPSTQPTDHTELEYSLQHIVMEHPREQGHPQPVAQFRTRADAEAFVAAAGPASVGVIERDGGVVDCRAERTFSIKLLCPCGELMEDARERVIWNREDHVIFCGWDCEALRTCAFQNGLVIPERAPGPEPSEVAGQNVPRTLEEAIASMAEGPIRSEASDRRVPRIPDEQIGRFQSGGPDGRNG